MRESISIEGKIDTGNTENRTHYAKYQMQTTNWKSKQCTPKCWIRHTSSMV